MLELPELWMRLSQRAERCGGLAARIAAATLLLLVVPIQTAGPFLSRDPASQRVLAVLLLLALPALLATFSSWVVCELFGLLAFHLEEDAPLGQYLEASGRDLRRFLVSAPATFAACLAASWLVLRLLPGLR